MNRLDSWRFGAATALTFSLMFTACALAFALSPEATFDFFNSWFHGLDLRLLQRPGGRALTVEQYAYGLAGVAGVSFFGGVLLAGLYNMFSPRRGPR